MSGGGESTQTLREFLGPRGIEQATYTMTGKQRVAFLIILVVLVGIVARGWALQLNTVLAVFFLISTLYRLCLVDVSLRRHQEIRLQDLDDREEWPSYVIQVPMYKEPRAVAEIVKAMNALDYPKDRMTVQLLIEEDDAETRQAAKTAKLAPPFEVVLIPVSQPRTKPKACNVGLALAKGDFLVIYDAEDRPETDQLKKAVLAFEQSESNVACIQGKLNFYNSNTNWLTRCFTAEYAMWFDLCLPGLDALRAPIPLGGTSNHFRLDVLRELKGWDEFNVTEDCDLGLRLFSSGYRTRMLDSTTWEEACTRLPVWYRQRSRWVKGYVQTYLVHTRSPLKHFRSLGFRNALHFHMLIGGSVISQLLSPFFWSLVVVWLVAVFGGARRFTQLAQFQEALSRYFPLPVFIMAACCLFLGNFLLLYTCAVACAKKGMTGAIRYTPLMPMYWLVSGLAAWKGSLQLIWSPHYWEKTEHHEGN